VMSAMVAPLDASRLLDRAGTGVPATSATPMMAGDGTPYKSMTAGDDIPK